MPEVPAFFLLYNKDNYESANKPIGDKNHGKPDVPPVAGTDPFKCDCGH